MSNRMSILFIFIFFFFAEARDIKTPPQINVTLDFNSSIVLNCTYEIESNESVRRVTWKKRHDVLAEFTSTEVIIFDNLLKERSQHLPFGQTNKSAILIINEVICEDEGIYECVVIFQQDTSMYTQMISNTTVHIQVDAEIPFELYFLPNSSLQEDDEVNISCTANVGTPNGKIMIWTNRSSSDSQRVVLDTSSLSENRRENCRTIAHLTIPYKLTRRDQDASFGCSSQSKQTKDYALSRIVEPIDVFYGPSSVSITASHPHNNLVVGNTIRLTCASDGNPTPNFTWNFNSTDIVNGKSYKLTDRNKTLEYRLKSINDSGYYQCIASNSINGKNKEMNASVFLTVNKVNIFQLKTAKSCSEIACSFFEECFEKDGAAICSMNIWKVTAFLFIAISLILGTITTHLCFSVGLRKMTFIPLKNKDKISKYSPQKSNDISQDDLCAYAEPKDVKRLDTQNMRHTDGRDNPYEDPVDMKLISTFKTPFIPESLSSDTNSQSHANAQVQNETFISPINQQRPGSLSDSGEFPKPPNCYNEAWV